MKHIRKLVTRKNNKSIQRVNSTPQANTNNKKIIKSKVVLVKKPIEKKKPLINIITRTSGRPNGFKRCHESIKNQSYANIRHIVSIDRIEDAEYVKHYDVDYFFIDKQKIAAQPDIPDPKTGKKFIYNLYFNELFAKVNGGWIMILDDDDYLVNKDAVLKMVNKIKNNTDMLIWQMKYPTGSMLPTISEMGHKPRLARIGSPCILVHSGIAKTIRWDGWKCGDFRFISQVWNKTNEKRWIKEPLVLLGSGGGFGLRKDIKNSDINISMKKAKDNSKIISNFKKKYTNSGSHENDSSIKPNRDKFTLKKYFNRRYVKKEDVDYDVIIVTGSYNRFDMVKRLISQFKEQGKSSNYSYKFILLNDGSSDVRYDSLQETHPEITYMKNKVSNGRYKYWKTMTTLFKEASQYKTNAVLQIDDDFILCNSFLNKLMDCFFELKSKNNRFLGISYHLYGRNHRTETRWGCSNGNWTDGGCLYDVNFLRYVNYSVDSVPKSRWKQNPRLSSGVWEQISRKITTYKGLIYKTKYSLVNHDGVIYSSMGRNKKKPNIHNTYKFIDNYGNVKP